MPTYLPAKASCPVKVLLFLFIGISSFKCNVSSDFIEKAYKPYDFETLDRLIPWKSPSSIETFEHRFVLITYISELSCQTCLKREIKMLHNLQAQQKVELDYAIVVHEPGATGDDFNPFLNNLRRISQLKGPILLEDKRGEAGLGKNFSFSLVDRQQKSIRCMYTPRPESNDWKLFEDEIIMILKATDRHK